jgi:hypothetical protein
MPPIVLNPIASIVIALMKNHSSIPSAIELAERTHARLFTVYVAWLVFAAIVSAIFTWAVWRAGNRQQDAVIAETNERTAKLERDAADSKATQQRVEIQLAEARTAQAAAEKSLLEIQERISDRHLPDREKFVAFLKEYKRGPVDIRYSAGDTEAHRFAVEIDSALKAAGWSESRVNDRVIIVPEPVRLIFSVHSGDSIPDHAGAIQQAFKATNIPTETRTDEAQEKGTIVLIVGSKPPPELHKD